MSDTSALSAVMCGILFGIAAYCFWRMLRAGRDECDARSLGKTLEIGKTYVITSDDPFRRPIRARIVDIKGGYVQYKYVADAGYLLQEPTSMKYKLFAEIYEEMAG